MRDNYDFTNGVKNPYAKRLKSQVTMNLDNDTIEYFKESASETGIPYQKLINLYLRDCVQNKRKPVLVWQSGD
ncbi:MAG: BrnA antitoxin family protein [Spirochaetales bacterium]|nr:BrnA antitoxin family protein [Spirochaetales bacterium]MBR1583871.1 BrnA antitoxin family protein [Spirochaetales bacterium]